MNLLLYPEAVKFKRRFPLDPKHFQYLEGGVREEAPYEVPAFAANGDKPLLYINFGNLGTGDTDLPKRIVAVVAEGPRKAAGLLDALHAGVRLIPSCRNAPRPATAADLVDWRPVPGPRSRPPGSRPLPPGQVRDLRSPALPARLPAPLPDEVLQQPKDCVKGRLYRDTGPRGEPDALQVKKCICLFFVINIL